MKMFKNAKILNLIICAALLLACILLFIDNYYIYYESIILIIFFSFILFLILKKTKIGRLASFLTIIWFVMVLFSCLITNYDEPSRKNAIVTDSLQKAKKIESFFYFPEQKFRLTKIEVQNEDYIVYFKSHITYRNDLIILSESGLLDENVKHVYFDTGYSIFFKTIKKLFKHKIEETVSNIDGVKSVDVDLSGWKDKKEIANVTLNVEIFNDFNKEKIEKTIKNILKGYNLTLNIKKSDERINYNWHKQYDDIILGAYRNKKYKEALEVVEYVNQKAENTYDETCTKKAISIEEKIKNDPKNYKLYIERGKLKTPGIRPLFSMDKENHCNGAFYENDIDSESAINDYKIALELNPNAYKAYELIAVAKKFSNGGTYEKPNYNDEILEYALKAAEGGEEYEHLYYDISKIYKLKKDKENADKYYKKAEEASKKYAEKLIQRTSRIIPDNPHVKHTK